MDISLQRTDDSVLTIRHEDVRAGWEQWYLLMSDAHWDNPHCDRRLLERHMEQAVKRNAGIFSFGDFFCAMQGKYDPRHVKSDIRPEHNGGNYLDLLVNTAVDWFEPYKANVMMVSDGNHEWSIETRLETSLTDRLAHGIGCVRMFEWGFIRFLFARQDGGRTSRIMYYHHGSGGGGPVTRGTIGTNRRNAYVATADFVVTGHIHEQMTLNTPVVRCNEAGKAVIQDRIHVTTATYKQEFTASGYHVRNQRPPKPLGGYWLRFYYDVRKEGRVASQLIATD